MRDRAKLRDARTLALAQGLQRISAQQTLADSLAFQAVCEADHQAAEDKTKDTLGYWTACLQSRTLDPHLLSGLAGLLEAADHTSQQAKADLDAAQSDTALRHEQHALCDVRFRQTGNTVTRLRKRVNRRVEEKALLALEHRTTAQRVKS